LAFLAGYAALVTLVIVPFTTSGLVAGMGGVLTFGLLIGSYLLRRWARRSTIYSAVPPPSPTDATSDFDEARMAKV